MCIKLQIELNIKANFFPRNEILFVAFFLDPLYIDFFELV